MSNSDQSQSPSFQDTTNGLKGFAAIAAQAFPPQLKTSPINENKKEENYGLNFGFSNAVGSGLSTSMLLPSQKSEISYKSTNPPSSASNHDYGHNSDIYNANPVSGNKRSRKVVNVTDGKVEDILSQICSEMDKLSTTDNNSNEDKILAFIQVLQCAHDEAQFYLESSAWSVETAVLLWLDNHNELEFSYSSSSTYRGPMLSTMFNRPHNDRIKDIVRYKPREVVIDGLPSDWKALVNPRNGLVYFVHQPTGHQQSSVPPGFADADPETSNSSPRDQNGEDEDSFNGRNADDDMLVGSAGDVIVQAEAVLVNVQPLPEEPVFTRRTSADMDDV